MDALPEDVLIFSSMGHKSFEIRVGNNTIIDVVLEVSDYSLDEVIVIGYGSRKRSDIVGSVATISSDELVAKPSSDLQGMLTGKIPGMYVSVSSARPGGSSNITIRGLNSLKGSTDPLYVVDGIPVTSINEINVDDVISVNVLKDASSQAIYGARASNGVILVTTRRGSDTKGKVNISYNGFVSIQNVKPNFELFNGDEFFQLRREAYRGDNASGINGWIGEYPADEDMFTPLELENKAQGNVVDWLDLAFLKNVPLSKQDISFSSGNEKTKYSSSLGYYNQQGVRYSSGYTRYSGKITLDHKITDWFNMGLSAYFTSFTQDRENSSWTDFMVISPVASVYDSNGDLELYPLGDGKTVNPLWWSQTRTLQNKGDRGIYNGYMELLPIPGLKYRMNLSIDLRNNENDEFIALDDPSNYLGNGLADVVISKTENYLIENILSYERTINKSNRFDIILLQSAYKRRWTSTQSTATLLGNDFFGINSLNSALESEVDRSQNIRTMLSYMGRFNWVLKDRYIFNFTLRADGSSVFGSNNKWGYFPSVALAWNMNKESFLENSDWLSESKLRLSWGQIGNEAISPYGSLATADNVYYVSNGTSIVGYLPGSSLPNPNLKWETTTTVNIGYDFSILDGRVYGAVDAYKRTTTDLLVDRTLPAGTGYTSMPDNLGKIENKGIEVDVNGYIFSSKDFSWSVGLGYSVNRNRLLEGVLTDSVGNYVDDINSRWFVNEPINVYYNYQFDGIWQIEDDIANSAQPFARPGDVRVADVTGDGFITPDDRVIIDRNPSWIGSVNTMVRYKNFEFAADIYMVRGVTRSSSFMSEYNYGGSLQGVLNGIKRDYWTPENPSNTTFRPHYATLSDYRSSLDYQDASYLRLTNVTLAYNLPESIVKKVRLSNVRLYVRGDNLLTFTRYLSLGPETDPEDYPETVSYTFGININF
ncbi:MAG: SusC/RagA family TonB-linked outer membrane protein [Bacteroidia bacterium]|nr:MAG: SusC/RagA family TonB-linked outer membrane protein [Bacteroidia bacterium]